jgi:hypothetical protein
MILQPSRGNWPSAASTVCPAVAAIATVVAVIYARRTVDESRAAAQAVADQHREQIAEVKASAAASHAASERESWNGGSAGIRVYEIPRPGWISMIRGDGFVRSSRAGWMNSVRLPICAAAARAAGPLGRGRMRRGSRESRFTSSSSLRGPDLSEVIPARNETISRLG